MFVRTEDLDRLVDKALDHAFASLGEASRGEASRGEASRGEKSRGDAALVPFVLVELPEETKLLRIVGAGAVEQAKRQIAAWDPTPLRYVIAVEAKLTLQDQSAAAAVLVEAGEKGAPKGGQWLNNFRRSGGTIERGERWFAKTVDNALAVPLVCPKCGTPFKPNA
jgi:hypothetical protein